MTTGTIEGVVLTEDKVPLADVTVILSGSLIVGKTRTTTTDIRGNYRFSGLTPGHYSIRAVHHDGDSSFERIDVVADRVITRNIFLLLSGGMTEIIVTAQRTNSSGANQGEVLDAEEIDQLPLPDNRYQDTLPLFPDITRDNEGDYHAIGSRNRQIAFFIDGENTTDPVTGTFGFNIPIDAIGSLEVLSFGYSAEYGQAQGGVINLITTTGEAEWTGTFYSFAPVLDYDGIDVMGIRSWNPGFSVSGPLFNDRLRLTFSAEYRYGVRRVDELPPGENRRYRNGFDLFLGLHFPLNDKHYIKLTAITFPLWLKNRYIAFNRPKETTVDYLQNGYALSLVDTFILTSSSTIETRLKYHQQRLALFPKGENPYQVHPETYAGNYYNEQDRTSKRYGISTVVSHAYTMLGDHQIRWGMQLEETDYRQHYENNDIEYYNANGFLYRRLSYEGSPVFTLDRFSTALFLQDDWQLSRRVIFFLGLRYDRNSLFRNDDFAPRLGLRFNPFSWDTTSFLIGWGRFYDQVPLVVAAFEEFPTRFETLYDEQSGLMTQDRFPTLNYLDQSLNTPYGDQWYVQWDQQWQPRFSTRVRYLEKQGYDELQDISIMKLKEEKYLDQKLLLTNANRSTYRSLSVGTNVTLLRKLTLAVDYVWSSAYGDGSDWNSTEGDNPSVDDDDSEWAPLPWDTTHRLLFRSSTPLFWGLSLSTVTEYRTGYPYSIIDEEQQIIGDKNTHRFPDYFRFDALLSKRFRFTKKFDVMAQGGAINLTNHFNPQYVQNNIDARDFGSYYDSEEISLQLQLRLVPHQK